MENLFLYVYVFVCVSIHVYRCIWVLMFVCTHTCRCQRLTSGIFLCCVAWDRVSHWTWSPPIQLDCLTSKLRGSPVSVRFTDVYHYMWLLGVLEIRAQMPSTVPTEPSSSPGNTGLDCKSIRKIYEKVISHCVCCPPEIPALGNQRQLKVPLGYIMSLRPAWSPWDPVSKSKTQAS